ncbi:MULTISPECIES: class I adenylate-forming enzyme family protein [unclassified Nocardioides]|uniref:class I adenylate-forming enzyme family protein n=1 Tax=unclassified Nocardioides TaxID=2615069 RepID=UPI003611AE6E
MNTTVTDPRAAAAAVLGSLTGPGGRFELVEDDVLGARLPVFAHRHRALHELVAASIEHGDRDYLVTATERVSFAEHAARVASLAQALTDLGVRRGDRVAIAAANSPAWITTFWATVSIGAVAVGVNAWWSDRELAYGIEHTSPVLVVADERRRRQLDQAGIEVPVLSIEADLPRLTAAHPDAPLPSADVDEDDPAVILFTSGTSGRPKGAVHTHRNLLAVVEYHRMNDALARAFGDPTDSRDRRYLLAMPLFHIGSLHNLAVPRLATGSAAVLHIGAFDADAVLRLVEQERVTHWGAVPTMATRLLEHPDVTRYDTSSLVAFSLASAPSSPALKQRLRDGLPFASALVDSYGLTESSTAIAVATPMDLEEAPGTLGRPIHGVQVEIRGLDGGPVAAGTEGEICVRSSYVMREYWNDAAATDAAIRADRWLHTGDIGTMDEQGRVRLSSRRSDLIIRGGENVYPAEVEGAIAEHAGVAEVVVVGVSHDDLGQEVAAVVVPRPGHALTADDLREHLTGQLAYYKLPAHWRITEQPLPRNATGKVIRTAVRP